MLGAVVSKYSLQRNSDHVDAFDVRLIELKDHPFMAQREGQKYRRDGEMRPWLNEDLQSFTPLRFAPPGLMNYEGRAVIMDPDIFAVGDIWELLSRDMQGAAIMCRHKSGRKGRKGAYASSVMLLDCFWTCSGTPRPPSCSTSWPPSSFLRGTRIADSRASTSRAADRSSVCSFFCWRSIALTDGSGGPG